MSEDTNVETAAPAMPKRRGRPPKSAKTNGANGSGAAVAAPVTAEAEAPKRRGRPPMNQDTSTEDVALKRRGRPKGVVTAVARSTNVSALAGTPGAIKDRVEALLQDIRHQEAKLAGMKNALKAIVPDISL